MEYDTVNERIESKRKKKKKKKVSQVRAKYYDRLL